MFDTANLGVVNIPVAGEVDIILQGVQFTLINKNGNKQDALPDVCSLTPTKEKETFVPVDVLSEFKAPPLRQENIRGLERQLHRKHELVSHRRRSHRKRKP